MGNGPITKQSFTAGSADIAGTVVAFETGSNDVPVKATFGVSVVGSQCGVYGQGTSDAQRDRRTAPFGTGVFGSGDVWGVCGITSRMSENDIPDNIGLIGEFPHTPTIGVVGVNNGDIPDESPAVFGDNFVLKDDLIKNEPVGTAIADATNLPVGVEGVSWAGHGVFGISLNLDPSKSKTTPVDPRVGGVAETARRPIQIEDPTFGMLGLPNSFNVTQPAGVLGLSVQGAGVRGVSRADRGGIFQSATTREVGDRAVAQIRLVPQQVKVDANFGPPALPADGQTGDLLALVYPDQNNPRGGQAHLWFCERGGHAGDLGPAVWREVSLGALVTGS